MIGMVEHEDMLLYNVRYARDAEKFLPLASYSLAIPMKLLKLIQHKRRTTFV